MVDEQDGKTTIERRVFLRWAGGAAAVTVLGGLSACGDGAGGSAMVEVPLESIPEGGRLRVLVGEMPVELVRGPAGVEARSLWCTHTGCEVKWVEDQESYICACHDGRFNARGEVIGGPPPGPLTPVAVSLDDGKIRVGDSS